MASLQPHLEVVEYESAVMARDAVSSELSKAITENGDPLGQLSLWQILDDFNMILNVLT